MENKNIHKPYGPYEKYFKRPLDICCGLAALIVFWWLYLIIAILVRVKLGSPVLFTQDRPGKDEKLFKLYKFRTMTDARDENGELLPDEMRLTKFGKLLRSTSLDELPEAFNIIRGELSVVGPRPLLPRDVAYMNDEQRRRHCVRPGLTGLAQCSGRNLLNWDTKLTTDTEYVNHLSFAMDCKIIFQTIVKVLKRDGVSFEAGTDMDLKDWNELKKKEDY
jgi:lipopolysaccharide/colanic/teichoic acid biosynthesis glycosyltransferase